MVRGLLVLAAAAAISLLARVSRASGPTCQPSLVQRQRYGFVALSPNWQQSYDTDQLRAGWAVDLGAPYHSTAPQGMDRAVVVRVFDGYRVDAGDLEPLVDRYPGAIWLIGNEPDCIWQDNVPPEEYARIYHDLCTFIKNRDRTGQVAAGGIVQPTPLRLAYLDRVLAAYQARYGQAMPVDLWHIHNAVLNEVSCAHDPGNCWGAEIPPGIDAPYGVVRTVDDNDNMAFFADQIWAFRQWMADRGYSGYPLIVTEYGVLMPSLYGFDTARVNAFMSATFAFFENSSDTVLGDPADGGRLVQRWAWFSLNDHLWTLEEPWGFNGNLFDPEAMAITAFGQHYASHTITFPPLSYVDLSPSAFGVQPVDVGASPTQTITRPLEVRIANVGTADSGTFAVALTYGGRVSGTLEQVVDNLPPASAQWLTFVLADLPPGSYGVSVEMDPGDQVAESLECNNTATTTLLAPSNRLSLPSITRQGTLATAQAGGLIREAVFQAPALDVEHSVPDGQRAPSGWQEFPVPTANSYPAQIAVDGDGGVWISERDGNKIARFDPQSRGWDEYEIPTTSSKPWGIALDLAGNVWFAETAANQIAMLDVGAGTFVEYVVPTDDSEPWDVAVGSDGAIWFTERAGNQIGKLATAGGGFTEYPLSTPGAQPAGLGFHSGYVYFAESAGDRIGRLNTTTGQVSEGLRGAGSQPQDVALTPSGGPWFTEPGANRIFLLDPSTLGMGWTVGVRTADSEPYGIAVDGNTLIWFTERVGNKLGRYRYPIGTFHYEFPLPTANSLPTGIAVDGEGCAWYTAPGANQIGRFCLILRYGYLPLVSKPPSR